VNLPYLLFAYTEQNTKFTSMGSTSSTPAGSPAEQTAERGKVHITNPVVNEQRHSERRKRCSRMLNSALEQRLSILGGTGSVQRWMRTGYRNPESLLWHSGRGELIT
jgi:hypothetical protein